MFPSSEQWLYLCNTLVTRCVNALHKTPDKNSPLSILVVKLDEIGDMATATHVFELLKQNYPKSTLSVLCKPFNKALIVNDPFIDRIITDSEYTDKRYDIVVELRGTWRTLFRTATFRPRLRADRGTVRLRHRGKQLHETDTNYEIIAPLLSQSTNTYAPKLYFSQADEQFVDGYLRQAGIKQYAILHTGARRALRRWPADRFAVVAMYLKHTFNLDIVFAGTAEDESRIADIMAQVPFPTFRFTEHTTLSQFAALCKNARFFMGNESGPLHIAAAFGIPLIGLYGPGVPDVFYPKGQKAMVIHHVLDCNPCDQIHCVRPENPCINLITMAEVQAGIDKLLR